MVIVRVNWRGWRHECMKAGSFSKIGGSLGENHDRLAYPHAERGERTSPSTRSVC